MTTKKIVSVLMVLFLTFSIIISWCWNKNLTTESDSIQVENTENVNIDEIKSSSTVWVITIKEWIDDTAKVNDFQKKLAKLFIDYTNAQLATNWLLMINPDKMSVDEFVKFWKDVVVQRKIVEQDANDIANFESSQISQKNQNKIILNVVKNILWVGVAYAQELINPPFTMFSADDIKIPENTMLTNPSSVNFSEWEPQSFSVEPTKWEQIDAVKWIVPKASILKLVQSTFGVTAKQAKDLMEDYYQSQAQNYKADANFYNKASVTAQAVSTSSKVALFVWWAIITAWWTAVLTAPVGWAVVAWMWANVWLIQWTLITANWVWAILEIWENSAVLWLASEATAANFKDINQTYSPVSNVLSLTSLKDWLEDPGNLMTIYERWKWWVEQWLDYVTMNVWDKKITVNTKNPKQSFLTQDGIMAKLPEWMINKIVSIEEMQKIIDEAKLAQQFVWVYEWKSKTPFNFNGQKYSFDVWTQMTVFSDWKVKLKFEDTWNFSYNVQNYPFSADYRFNWSANGTITQTWSVDGNWNFSSTAKVNLPNWMNLPPEYASKLQGGSAWTVNINWTMEWESFVWKVIFTSKDGITEQWDVVLEKK